VSKNVRDYFAVSLSLLFCLGFAASETRADDPTKEQLKFFEEKIRPILNDHCFACHSSEKQESDLRLDSREFVLKGGASGPAAKAEDADDSLIIEVMEYGGDIEMPPDQRLDDGVIDDFRQWIDDGMAWPKSKDDVSEKPMTIEERVADHKMTHWSYRKVTRPETLKLEQDNWSRNAIDQLLLKLMRLKLVTPSPEADRFTLTKRLYIDLLGVPPTYPEVKRVQDDASADWYERLVDRLLASPRYGERWGRHWMDVARYADTRGYAFAKDRNYPHAYTYRDYVIDAFNSDKPYDVFVNEQLAADQLESREDLERLAGLGFLTVGRKFVNKHDDIDDQIDVVSRGLMGLTVSCARCHDHKYDAIPTADYYSLYGVFASSREGDLPYIGEKETVDQFVLQKKKVDALQNDYDQFLRTKQSEIGDQLRLNVDAYLAQLLHGLKPLDFSSVDFVTIDSSSVKRRVIRRWRDYIKRIGNDSHPLWMPWFKLSALGDNDRFAKLAGQMISDWQKPEVKINALLLDELKANPPQKRIEIARVYGKVLADVYLAWKEKGSNDSGLSKLSQPQQQVGIALFTDNTPTNVKIDQVASLLNDAERKIYLGKKEAVGNLRSRLPSEPDRAMVVADLPKPVEPFVFLRGQAGRRGKQVPRQFVAVLSPEAREPFKKGSGRLELAEKITSKSNPLTPRVIANRIWMHHFGKPLVSTPSDFGQRCEQPVQHELLDYLAATLIEDDWSIKALHRTIVLSAAYRQQSIQRDEAYAIDPDNYLIWRMNRKRFEFEPLRDSMLYVSGELDLAVGGKSVDITKAPFSKRRAVYGYIDRQDLPNLFRAFDFASPDSSTAKRTKTTVPQQLLFMMNSPFVAERSKSISNKVNVDSDPREQVTQLYRIVFSRDPKATEISVGERFLRRESGNPSRLQNLAQLLLLTNEFCFAD